MKLSEKQSQAIYDAVAKRIMTARVEIAGICVGEDIPKEVENRIDFVIAQAQSGAASAAVEAVKGKASNGK